MDVNMLLSGSHTELAHNMGKAIVSNDIKANTKIARIFSDQGMETWELPSAIFTPETYRGLPVMAYADVRRLGKQVADGT